MEKNKNNLEREVLAFCDYCESIRVGNDSDLWLKKEVNQDLYQIYMEKYEGKLSHTFCPDCKDTAYRKAYGD